MDSANPDDQLDINEVLRQLHALSEHLPTAMHEQVSAVKAETEALKADTKADTEVVLELQGELEKKTNAETVAQLKDTLLLLDMTSNLDLRSYQALTLNLIQSALLQHLTIAVFGPKLSEAHRLMAVTRAQRLSAALSEFHRLPDEKWMEKDVIKEIVARVFPTGPPPSSVAHAAPPRRSSTRTPPSS